MRAVLVPSACSTTSEARGAALFAQHPICEGNMFRITREQQEIFEAQVLVHFEDELMAHGHKFSPRLCRALGDEHLRGVVRNAVHRARTVGFTCQGPVRLFLELSFLFGSEFPIDPQYSRFGAVLRAQKTQMIRSLRLYEEARNYAREVVGPEQAYVRSAIVQFLDFLENQDLTTIRGSSAQDALVSIYPQKACYVGKKALRALIGSSRAAEREHGLEGTGAFILLASLMFAFGHGCVSDPLFTWIPSTLRDPLHPNPAARLRRLERKTRAWFRAMTAE